MTVPILHPSPTATAPDESWRDEHLMVAYQRLDARAFGVLYKRYRGQLHRYFVRRLGDREKASDLLQQAFLRVHRARGSYDPDRSFRTWLISIAANLAKDEYQRRARHPGHQEWIESALGSVRDNSRRQEERLIVAERRRRLRVALEALPRGQRDVIIMHKVRGASFPEIARARGESVEALKSRAFRGYRALRAILEASVDDVGREVDPIHRGCDRCPGVA